MSDYPETVATNESHQDSKILFCLITVNKLMMSNRCCPLTLK